MKIAIETKQNKIAFFSIDGRALNKLIKKAEREVKDLKQIWSYSHVERSENSSIGVYKNTKTIKVYNWALTEDLTKDFPLILNELIIKAVYLTN